MTIITEAQMSYMIVLTDGELEYIHELAKYSRSKTAMVVMLRQFVTHILGKPCSLMEAKDFVQHNLDQSIWEC